MSQPTSTRMATKRNRIVLGVVVLLTGVEVLPQELPQEINNSTLGSLLRAAVGSTEPVPPPPSITLVRVELVDDGDNDGWADTHEAVSVTITVRNRMGFALTGITARLATADPRVDCVGSSEVTIADMQEGDIRRASSAFEMVMGGFERADLAEELVAVLEVELSANELTPPFPRFTIRLDLDLDAGGGAGSTVWYEGFESGLGAFAAMPIDEPLNPPDGDLDNAELGLQNADGYRCQYSDPDWEESFSYGSSAGAHCYPNPEGAADAFYFQASGDRAFSGSASLYFGIPLDPASGFTTPMAQLEAVRTASPIALDWRRRCSVSQSTPCASDLDCPVGESCALPLSELVWKHQVSLVDHRMLNTHGLPRTLDRGVVQVQLADDAGDPLGPWIKLEPYVNAYDTEPDPAFTNCKFDPVDDGNTEADFFDPEDPSRLFGPSSTCLPERTFVHQGETGEPFDAAATGDAPDGPGLEGASGTGTWMESRVDLSPFRGRRLWIRFLVSQIKIGSTTDWEEFTGDNPTPIDDGWFIDDVLVTDTLESAAIVTVDSKPNDDLVELHDPDGDHVLMDCDCGPTDPDVWSLPGEVGNVHLSHAGGVDGLTSISWSPPDALGGTQVFYDVLASLSAGDFTGSTCLDDADLLDLAATDESALPGDHILFFLVRAGHACGDGSLGTHSSGVARLGGPCER